MIIRFLRGLVSLLVLTTSPISELVAAPPDPLVGTWEWTASELDLRVAIQRTGDDYFATLLWSDEDLPGHENERVDYAIAFRCRMDGDILGQSTVLFALSWCDHGVDEERAEDWKLRIDRNQKGLWLLEPFQTATALRRTSDALPRLGTWVVDLEPGPQSRDQRELMVVRADGEYRVTEVRVLTNFRDLTESEARDGNPREALKEIESRIEYRATWCGGYLVLVPVIVVLEDGTHVELRDDHGLASALGVEGPIYLLFSEDRALYVAPQVKEHAFPRVDYGPRQVAIFDGSFDGEWRATGTFSARDERWEYVVDASIKAVLDDLYTVQIRCELWPRERGRDAGERWEAFCRGVGDRAGSVALSGSKSTVERGEGPPETQPGWNGKLDWKNGKPRLVVGPGENRFQFILTRADSTGD